MLTNCSHAQKLGPHLLQVINNTVKIEQRKEAQAAIIGQHITLRLIIMSLLKYFTLKPRDFITESVLLCHDLLLLAYGTKSNMTRRKKLEVVMSKFHRLTRLLQPSMHSKMEVVKPLNILKKKISSHLPFGIG